MYMILSTLERQIKKVAKQTIHNFVFKDSNNVVKLAIFHSKQWKECFTLQSRNDQIWVRVFINTPITTF